MTYKEIQEEYKRLHSKTIKTCWIADLKRELGIPTRIAKNRINNNEIKHPCSEQVKEKLTRIIID